MFLPSIAGLLFVVFVWGIFVGTAHAGFLSFLNKIFGANTEETDKYNSQTLPVLSAPTTSDPKLATGGAVINFVEGSSILPVVGPLGSIADAETYRLGQITTYVVRSGDNLSKIADMFGVSVSTIYWANNLKQGDQIKIGDVLVILPISGLQYEVKKGDTVQSLAKKYKSDTPEIIAYNNLPTDGVLEEGTTIIIPDAELGPVPGTTAKSKYKGGGGPEIAGYFTRPIIGGRKSQGLHGFNGVDLANSCGTPVFAAAGGTVIITKSQGWNGGYGRYVVIAHPNGTQTVYSHLSLVNVGLGQYVPQGQQVGGIGSTGASTGCHVHFEVRGARNPF